MTEVLEKSINTGAVFAEQQLGQSQQAQNLQRAQAQTQLLTQQWPQGGEAWTQIEAYQRGAAHLYLGVLATLLPEAMGGKPEEGRSHFERAAQLSGDRDLMPKVLLASEYARLVFDRQLHDTLCREVLEADPVEPGLTLSNTLAQNEAERLLADSLDYFGE